MKAIKTLVLLLALGLSAYGQGVVVTANKLKGSDTAPSGTCGAQRIELTTAGVVWVCAGGTWITSSVSNSNPFADSTAIIKGSADATKLLKIEVDGFTTGTTRTLTPQDGNYTIAGTDIAQTVSALNKFTGGLESHKGNDNGVVIGYFAGAQNPTSDAVAIGFFANGETTDLNTQGVFIGRHAGAHALGTGQSVVVGHAACQYCKDSSSSVILGYLAGRNPLNDANHHSFSAVIAGHEANANGVNAQTSTILGAQAAYNATNAIAATIIGYSAGFAATNANNAVILGTLAGRNATNAGNSVFIGARAGYSLSRNYSLVIESHPTYSDAGNTGLIYGEFDNRVLKFNGSTTVQAPANNVSALNVLRFTDTSPTGNFLRFRNAADSSTLFAVDVNGAVVTGSWTGSVIGSAYGGAGTVNGLLKANGSGTVSAATAGTDYAAAGAVTTSGLTMATSRILGRTTASTGAVEELTGASATALLSAFTGDSGSGGVKGLVPAPAAGDAAAGRFLKADGSWSIPSGGGGGGTTINSTDGQVPYRVNSTTFGNSAFASNALNSTYLSATSGASGAGLTLTVGGGGSEERLTIIPKTAGVIGRVRLQTVNSTDYWQFTGGSIAYEKNAVGQALRIIGDDGGGSSAAQIMLGANSLITFQSTNRTDTGSSVTGIAQLSSGVLRITNASTGAGQLLVGTSTNTADAQLSVYSQSTIRPGLKLNMPSGTSGSQEASGVYDNGTLSYAVRTDGKIVYVSGNTGTTVGAAGGASALPATPTGYLQVVIGGTTYKIPYYAN